MSAGALRILLVEDNPGDARLIREMLAEADLVHCELVHADSVTEAVAALASGPVDAVLLDLSLPDAQGLDTLERVRTDASETPIVVLTGLGDDGVALRAVREGAQDYLVKGEFGERALVRSLRYAIERSRTERAERERRGLEAALNAMERMLGILGHELRTPLTSLRLLSEHLLTDATTVGDQYQNFLRSINGEVLRMTDMVNNLLEAARLDSGVSQWNWSLVEPARVCAEATELLRPLVNGEKLTLGVDVEPATLTFNGDPDAIRRLIVNLVNNAIKHTPEGRIDVAVRELWSDGERWAHLTVRDTGSGIPDEILGKLGDAFAINSGVAGSSASGGTGLGLAICKGIAAAHGGLITVSSIKGQGSTLTVLLRADLEAPAPVPDDLRIIREAAA